MKKLFAFILSAVMLFGIGSALTGCGTQYKKKIIWEEPRVGSEIHGLFPSGGSNFNDQVYTAKYIDRATGYKTVYHEISEGNADNDINNSLTTRAQYNFYKLTEAQYHPYLKGETFLDLTPLLEKTASGRLLYQLIDLMPYGWEAVSYVDDKGVKHIYGVPDFGYCAMQETALIWNTDHLKKAGINKVPNTLTEVTDAFKALQEQYKSVDGYHAFGVPGSNYCTMANLTGAFEVPFSFFVDDDGNIQCYIYSDNTTNYAKYMNYLLRQSYISTGWQQSSPEDAMAKFADGLFSCVCLPYWYVKPLVNTIVKVNKLAPAAGYSGTENNYENVRNNVLAWQLRVAGDGSFGSPDQHGKGHIEGTDASVPYYTIIPAYMADTATTTIDYLAKKLLAYDEFYGGEEGVHFNEVAAPAGAPEYDPENPFALNAYEDRENKILFLRPWEYQYYEYKNIHDENGLITGVELAKEEPTVKRGGGKWIQLTDAYDAAMDSNSSFATGTNSVSANCLFHIREIAFDSWTVIMAMDDTIIRNPMVMCPPIESWMPISILSRTQAKRGVATAIDQKDEDGVTAQIELTRKGLKTTMKKKDGVKYYYWSDEIVKEMTDWYKEVKLGND